MAECTAPEWLIEEGIGETRALLVAGERVLAARLMWPGELAAGTHCAGKLAAKLKGSRRGVAMLDDGSEALVDHLPQAATEGQMLDLVITRAAIAERGRLKRAQARVAGGDAPATTAPFVGGRTVRRFPAGLWEDVWHAASSASIAFPGGEIIVSVTPAMTVIDIDGIGAARDVALAAVPAIAQAIGWFDIGGNIGIDFPTIVSKDDRRIVDRALGIALDEWAHERTAMNGFGFVQLVARLEGPSLLHRFATARLGASARMALRRAELAEGTGRVLVLTAHPALKAKLKEPWLADLARRTGREVRVDIDPGLAIEAAHAQFVEA
ncbi:ribonuclease [Porphyrobacter sp. AAP60]|uniref:ribonuclease n=1 Tax=Porphyrobacter sp. AAP60 TaxID=1523423 RepID=UPI0006B949BE|nr:ribonuclease [Porphyrobacter sp. AAP60]KPF64794.1 ribonuclease [Porphyrobacter sp. AAP60]